MKTTNGAPVDEVTAWLETHNFAYNARRRCYQHRSGNAAVSVDDVACFTVCALTHDRARLVLWEARLIHAPLSVFATTVAAALT